MTIKELSRARQVALEALPELEAHLQPQARKLINQTFAEELADLLKLPAILKQDLEEIGEV